VSRPSIETESFRNPLRNASERHLVARDSWVRRTLKALAWKGFGQVLFCAKLGYSILGVTRRVDTIIYKVDRLGDWLLVEPTITRIVTETRSRGETVVVWAALEAAAIREWRTPDYKVEEFFLEPKGLAAKVRRAFAVVGLLARYRARRFICLRYSPEPVRDFVLANVNAEEIYALSWRIAAGPPATIPHEVYRHHAILASVGLEPKNPEELLPRISVWRGRSARRVVLAPFSSAKIKDWMDESWCKVAEALTSRELLFEIWVGADQRAMADGLARKMAEHLGTNNIEIRSGPLGQLAEAVGSAHLVLTVDTFAAHLAVALDARMVCLIGGGQFGDFGPWHNSARQRWVTYELPCFGCNWRCTRVRVECLEDIPVSRVLLEIEAALAVTSVRSST